MIAANRWSQSDQKAIREQLDRILNSRPFHQAPRRQRFLEYIVNEALAGRGERLKGYNVALAVFDRAETFDSNIDPIVRLEAGRLRDRLREYYETDGQNDPIRIDLPKGSYTPHVEFRQAATSDALPDGLEGPHAVTQDQSPNLAKAPFAVVDDQASTAPPRTERRVRWQIIVPALVLIPMFGVASAWLTRDLWMPTVPERAVENPLIGMPEGPAIAVLPFTNLSDDPKQEYFSDGLTEDLMTALSRASSDLRVLARNTTFQYKGKAVDVPKLGRELGARYVFEGSVRRSEDGLRVTAQLIDTQTGAHIWADRFDRKMADIFLVQDEIVSQIVAKIAGGYGVIEINEARSAAQKTPQEIQAYDLVLRAHEVMLWEWNRGNFRSAKEIVAPGDRARSDERPSAPRAGLPGCNRLGIPL